MFGCSSFPMSLADRSFDSDGNCVCVFFFAPFFCRVSVLDCCTGQSTSNEMTTVGHT